MHETYRCSTVRHIVLSDGLTTIQYEGEFLVDLELSAPLVTIRAHGQSNSRHRPDRNGERVLPGFVFYTAPSMIKEMW